MTDDVQRLRQLFPDVKPEILARIIDAYSDPSIAQVAAVLDEMAERGSVPDKNYTGKAAEEIVDDQVEEAGFSKETAMHGLQAEQEVQHTSWEARAKSTITSGTIGDIVELHNKLHRVGTESLNAPSRGSMPDDVEQATVMLANEMAERVNAAAEAGDIGRLNELDEAFARLAFDPIRKQMSKKIWRMRNIATNEGTEYEQARNYVLDDDNTPSELQRAVDDIRDGRFDITYEQLVEITREATEWMQEYREAAEQRIETEIQTIVEAGTALSTNEVRDAIEEKGFEAAAQELLTEEELAHLRTDDEDGAAPAA